MPKTTINVNKIEKSEFYKNIRSTTIGALGEFNNGYGKRILNNVRRDIEKKSKTGDFALIVDLEDDEFVVLSQNEREKVKGSAENALVYVIQTLREEGFIAYWRSPKSGRIEWDEHLSA